jgi:hypothetical protein
MSDQQAPATPDTPAVAGPNEAPGTQEQPQVDWEKRYQDLQPEYTRATQRLSELEQQQQWYELAMTTEDPDTQRQALKHLGYDIPEEVEDVEPAEWMEEDPVADLRKEIDELRSWKEQSTQQQQEEAAQQYFDSHMESEIERLGLGDLSEHQLRMVLALSTQSTVPAPPGAPIQAVPNVEAAYKQWQEDMLEEQKSWASTKKRAPYVPSGGLPANEVPDPGTGHNARMNRVAKFLQEAEE